MKKSDLPVSVQFFIYTQNHVMSYQLSLSQEKAISALSINSITFKLSSWLSSKLSSSTPTAFLDGGAKDQKNTNKEWQILSIPGGGSGGWCLNFFLAFSQHGTGNLAAI